MKPVIIGEPNPLSPTEKMLLKSFNFISLDDLIANKDLTNDTSLAIESSIRSIQDHLEKSTEDEPEKREKIYCHLPNGLSIAQVPDTASSIEVFFMENNYTNEISICSHQVGYWVEELIDDWMDCDGDEPGIPIPPMANDDPIPEDALHTLETFLHELLGSPSTEANATTAEIDSYKIYLYEELLKRTLLKDEVPQHSDLAYLITALHAIIEDIVSAITQTEI